MQRRTFITLAAGFVAAACSRRSSNDNTGSAATSASGAGAKTSASNPSATAEAIEVWKDPSCGCCKSWIEHMKTNGFAVTAHDVADMTPIKQSHGIGADLVSCHTAVTNGYVIEGHVPADLVHRIIAEKPKIAGLAVPGMPMGSPGMEGDMKDPYDVVAFKTDGTRTVYASR